MLYHLFVEGAFIDIAGFRLWHIVKKRSPFIALILSGAQPLKIAVYSGLYNRIVERFGGIIDKLSVFESHAFRVIEQGHSSADNKAVVTLFCFTLGFFFVRLRLGGLLQLHQISEKDKQIAEKDKQISALSEQNANLTTTLNQQQALHAGTIQSMLMQQQKESASPDIVKPQPTEQASAEPEQQPPKEPAEDPPPQKLSFFQRLFRKRSE